jgi:hypothetical protein
MYIYKLKPDGITGFVEGCFSVQFVKSQKTG